MPPRSSDPAPVIDEPLVDFYQLLHVEPSADAAALRDAYRREARRHHPDAGGEAFYMTALNKAYAILRDPASRRAYDRKLGLVRPTTTTATPSPATEETPIAPPSTGRASGSVLDFGRYAGWSIGQLARHDPDYLLWLERTPIGRPFRPEIQATLGSVARG